MATRRMLSRDVMRNGTFMMQSASSRMLYVDLCMEADDDGVVCNPVIVTRMSGASGADMEELVSNGFLIPMCGCVVVKHWRMHNCIKKDRYKPSAYSDVTSQLYIKPNRSYTTDPNKGRPVVQ